MPFGTPPPSIFKPAPADPANDRTIAIQAAKTAGFTGKGLETIVAIGGAESGYNAKAHNAKPPDDSYGIWQINMLGALGPARRAQYGIQANSDLFDPVTNAKAAWKISGGGTNFSPWSTYTNGAYKKHLSPVDNGYDPGQGKGGLPSLPKVPDIPGAISAGINAITSQLGKIAGMTVTIILAVALLVVGIVLIRQKDIKSTVKTIAKVAA